MRGRKHCRAATRRLFYGARKRFFTFRSGHSRENPRYCADRLDDMPPALPPVSPPTVAPAVVPSVAFAPVEPASVPLVAPAANTIDETSTVMPVAARRTRRFAFIRVLGAAPCSGELSPYQDQSLATPGERVSAPRARGFGRRPPRLIAPRTLWLHRAHARATRLDAPHRVGQALADAHGRSAPGARSGRAHEKKIK